MKLSSLENQFAIIFISVAWAGVKYETNFFEKCWFSENWTTNQGEKNIIFDTIWCFKGRHGLNIYGGIEAYRLQEAF